MPPGIWGPERARERVHSWAALSQGLRIFITVLSLLAPFGTSPPLSSSGKCQHLKVSTAWWDRHQSSQESLLSHRHEKKKITRQKQEHINLCFNAHYRNMNIFFFFFFLQFPHWIRHIGDQSFSCFWHQGVLTAWMRCDVNLQTEGLYNVRLLVSLSRVIPFLWHKLFHGSLFS